MALGFFLLASMAGPAGAGAGEVGERSGAVVEEGDAEAEAILAQVDKNLHPGPLELYWRIENDGFGGQGEAVVIYGAMSGGDRVFARVVAPPEMRGRAALRVGSDVWVHDQPMSIDLQRQTLAQSFIESNVFNNADLLRLDYAVQHQAAMAPEQDDPDNHLLWLIPRDESAPYRKLEMVVDRSLLVPRLERQFGPADFLIKTIRFEELENFVDQFRRPVLLRARSGLNAGYGGAMRLGFMRQRAFPAQVFTVPALTQGRQLWEALME